MDILNKAQADALFQREAVLMDTQDLIPDDRVMELFGERAVEFAHRMGGGGGYGIGDYTAFGLTYKGFQAAVSYHNVERIRAQAIARQQGGARIVDISTLRPGRCAGKG